MSQEADSGPIVAGDADPSPVLSLEDALPIIGEETRARILVELGEAVRDDDVSPAVLSFSELMDRVGVEDSGRFNYHLDKLVGTFVRSVESGYSLRPPGHSLYRAIVSGTITGRESVDPFDVGDCPECGEPLTARDEERHYLSVRCSSCESFTTALALPERALDGRSRDGVVEAAIRASRHKLGLVREGVCHACHARVDRELRLDAPHGCDSLCDFEAYAVVFCSACNVRGVDRPARVALTAPPVVGFFADHGRDANAIPPWEEPVTDACDSTTVITEDPTTVAVTYEIDDERLRVVLDDDLQVVEADRSAA